MRVSEESMVKALTTGAINRRAAIQLELAVGLVAFLLHGDEAKKKLLDFYEAADYECRFGESDYKTINRRINASGELFERLGREAIAKLVERKREMSAIHAVARRLVDLNIASIDDARDRKPVKPRVKLRRRWTDEERKNAITITTEHVTIHLPPTITRHEGMELALKIAQIAERLNGYQNHV